MGQRRVLLVDDDPAILRAARLALQHVGGFELSVASSGPLGVQIAREDPPDVILLAASMAGFDGVATFAALREQPRTSVVPVIFLVGDGASPGKLQALGALGILRKPFDVVSLAQEIEQLLTAREARAEASGAPSFRSAQPVPRAAIMPPTIPTLRAVRGSSETAATPDAPESQVTRRAVWTRPATSAKAAAPRREGDALTGDYQLLTRLHQGERHDVWTGKSKSSSREVAIKLPRTVGDAETAYLAQQVRALSAIQHRSMPRRIDNGTASNGEPYLVMERLNGATLATRLSELGRGMPTTEAVRLLLPIAHALSVGHAQGLAHGNVAAEHVFLATMPDGTLIPKLLGFGGWPIFGRDDAPSSDVQAAGAPGAPERIDVLGFAATLWHAITGATPSDTEVQSIRPDGAPPQPDLSQRDPVLYRLLSRTLRPESQRARGLRELGHGLRVWAEHRGIDTDVLGAPLRVIWPG